MDRIDVWSRILNNEGKTVYTKTGLPFTYEKVDDEKVKIYREDKAMGYVSKEAITLILRNPNEPRHFYRDNIKERTSSYALALVDAAITGFEEN